MYAEKPREVPWSRPRGSVDYWSEPCGIPFGAFYRHLDSKVAFRDSFGAFWAPGRQSAVRQALEAQLLLFGHLDGKLVAHISWRLILKGLAGKWLSDGIWRLFLRISRAWAAKRLSDNFWRPICSIFGTWGAKWFSDRFLGAIVPGKVNPRWT